MPTFFELAQLLVEETDIITDVSTGLMKVNIQQNNCFLVIVQNEHDQWGTSGLLKSSNFFISFHFHCQCLNSLL
jgi:hypothetical protein